MKGSELPAALRARRIALGLTQREVGERLGVLSSTVLRFEQSTNPSIATVRRYADALDCDLKLRLTHPEHGTINVDLAGT